MPFEQNNKPYVDMSVDELVIENRRTADEIVVALAEDRHDDVRQLRKRATLIANNLAYRRSV